MQVLCHLIELLAGHLKTRMIIDLHNWRLAEAQPRGNCQSALPRRQETSQPIRDEEAKNPDGNQGGRRIGFIRARGWC
jgi:hypothetical protein